MLKTPFGNEDSAAGSVSGKSKSRSATVEGASGHGGSTVEGARETSPGKSHERLPGDPVKEHVLPAMDEMAKKVEAAMQEQRTKRSEERIAKLVSRLGLDSAQEARLREFFRKQDAATDIAVEDGGRKIRMASQQDGDSLEDFMKGLLNDPQKQSYEELKEAESNQRVEARTLRDMASLTQAVELRDDQREAVYGVLQEEARKESAGGAGAAMPLGLNFMSDVDLGPGGAIGSVAAVEVRDADGEAKSDPGELMSRLRQQQQAQIDEKVNRLNGILDEQQLAQYRSHLQQGVLLPGP